MQVSSPQRAPLQFSLRALMLAMFVFAVVAVNWKLILYAAEWFWLMAIFFVAVFYILGRAACFVFLPESSGKFRRVIVWVPGVLSLVLLGVALWTRYRWYVGWYVGWGKPLWPRPFPYPDSLLLAFHNRLDALNPVPPGYIKIHGEVYLVLFLLNVAAWIACSWFGFQLGLLCDVKVLAKQLLRFMTGVWRRISKFVITERPQPPMD